jgi:Pectate lyase superfamily protein
MCRILFSILLCLTAAASAQFVRGQVLTSGELIAALASPTITRGTINGAVIGGLNPVAAYFTTLSASSANPALYYQTSGTGAVARTFTGKFADPVSIRDYAANGTSGVAVDPTGVVDSAGGFNAAIAAVSTNGGRVVVPAGTYLIGSTVTVPKGVALVGQGSHFSILLAKAGTAMDVIRTQNFGTLTGTNIAAGPYGFAIQGITIDGNNAHRTGGRNLAIYGYSYTLRDVVSKNSAGVGIYSEWATDNTVPVVAGGDGMESHWYDVKSWGSISDGIDFFGPHDSILHDTETFVNGRYGIYINETAAHAASCVIGSLHSYGNRSIGVYIDNTSVIATNLQSENNRSTGGILITGNSVVEASSISIYSNTGYGISNAASSVRLGEVLTTGNSGDGFVNTASAINVSNLYSTANGGWGINGVQSSDNFSNVFVNFNSSGGIQVASGASGYILTGQSSSNTGTQLVLNSMGAGAIISMLSYTVAGQTGYSGTLNSANTISYVSTGSSFQTINQFAGPSLTVNGKTLAVNNSITLAGTDSTTMTFPSTSATIARTDAAQSFTGTQTFSGASATSYSLNGILLKSATAPTISSGFGSSPSIASKNGTATFRLNVGTGGTANSGVIDMPTAANGWNCHFDVFNPSSANLPSRTVITASSASSVTVTNELTSSGAAIAWPASTVLIGSCLAY